jgi:F-type H+-transporting ATPase subunit b
MEIDWLTVAAQIVNFLVLVWLLNRFLYGPITRAMKAREENIGARLTEADERRQYADSEADRFRAMQAELDARRAELIDQAEEAARQKREELEEELRETAELRRAAWADEIEAERANILRDLRRRSGEHVQEVVRRALDQVASADLAPALAERFITELEALDDEALQKLRDTVEKRSSKALVESSLALPSPVRGQVTKALHKVISPEVEPEYLEDSTIGLGVRLTIGEQVAEWSAGVWLDQMDEALGELLETMGEELREEPA